MIIHLFSPDCHEVYTKNDEGINMICLFSVRRVRVLQRDDPGCWHVKVQYAAQPQDQCEKFAVKSYSSIVCELTTVLRQMKPKYSKVPCNSRPLP